LKTSIHLSRSNGYRELGMYDESILELESINQDDVWTYEVIKAKYLTYWDAKQFEMAEAMTKAMRIYHNNRTEGWLLRAECINETKGAKEAAEMFLLQTRIALRNKRMCCLRLGDTWHWRMI
jgi:hypothetical protein